MLQYQSTSQCYGKQSFTMLGKSSATMLCSRSAITAAVKAAPHNAVSAQHLTMLCHGITHSSVSSSVTCCIRSPVQIVQLVAGTINMAIKSLWIVPTLLQHFKSRWLLVVAATLLRHMPNRALLACMGIPISPSSMAYSGHIVYITLEREFVRAKCCIHSPVQSIVQLVAT